MSHNADLVARHGARTGRTLEPFLPPCSSTPSLFLLPSAAQGMVLWQPLHHAPSGPYPMQPPHVPVCWLQSENR